jgi:hypothetical protein
MFTATSVTARVVILTALYVASFVITVSALEVWQKPRRCCSPDQWEADVRNLGTTTRSRDPEVKVTDEYYFISKDLSCETACVLKMSERQCLDDL